jgi:5,5'-dehydrodivanillate O-demethylase
MCEMLTSEQNERLTKVGPGTPCGNLLRQYWQVLCPVAEITAARPKKRIRILGEDLLLFRSAEGELVCIEEHCSHRNVSLYRGFIEEGGIRCCYHGWKFDCSGQCIERPFETVEPPPAAHLKTYPLATLGGLVFAFMGAGTPPVLPRWDVLVREDRPRSILVMPIHQCNWLQIQENTVDSVHSYYLHGHMARLDNVDLKDGAQGAFYYRTITAYDWRTSDLGIEKVLKYSDAPEIEVRPPLIFPNILRIPEGPREALHFRVPVDDENTRIIHVELLPAESAEVLPADATPFRYDPDGPIGDDVELNSFYLQDRVAWETQGVIADRSREVLGASDRGIVLFRRMLAEQIDRVERGEAPTVAVISPADRERMIDFSRDTLEWSWAEFKSRTMWDRATEPVA